MTGRADAGLRSAIPALPVRDVAAAVAHYRDRLGFEARHEEEGFAILVRDGAELDLWRAGDEAWRGRGDLRERPVCSGAESFIAGTASCGIEVADVDGLFAELEAADVLHEVSRDGVRRTEWGTRQVDALDLDGNLLTFYVRDGG